MLPGLGPFPMAFKIQSDQFELFTADITRICLPFGLMRLHDAKAPSRWATLTKATPWFSRGHCDQRSGQRSQIGSKTNGRRPAAETPSALIGRIRPQMTQISQDLSRFAGFGSLPFAECEIRGGNLNAARDVACLSYFICAICEICGSHFSGLSPASSAVRVSCPHLRCIALDNGPQDPQTGTAGTHRFAGG